MNLVWLPTAERNLEDQIAYIAERNPEAAIVIGDAIEAAISNLLDYPRIGRPGRVQGTRELVVNGTPYLVAYKLEATSIVVLRIFHGAQLWPSSF